MMAEVGSTPTLLNPKVVCLGDGWDGQYQIDNIFQRVSKNVSPWQLHDNFQERKKNCKLSNIEIFL